jgi:polysaccharide pyruvyl transferase WcaK-like protein
VRLIVGEYTPGEMRHIISKTDVFLAYRFHAMVSALAMGVPVAAVSWSHKYREVLAQFGLDYCVDQKAGAESILAMMGRLITNRAVVRERILSRLPEITESSGRNFEILKGFVRSDGVRGETRV